MQSAKIEHYSLPSIMLDTKSTTNSVEQNERLLQNTSHVFSSLAILPRQQSLELSGYLRHSDSVDSIIPLKLLFSYFSVAKYKTCNTRRYTLLYHHALTITIRILLLKDTILFSSYSTLGISDGYKLSQYGSLANY